MTHPHVALASPIPLSEARFLATHVAFETSSDQQSQILAHLGRFVERAPSSVLSIGCGSGILDAPLAQRLRAGGPLRYVGLDPNPVECGAFRERLASLDVQDEVVVGPLETFETPERFDLVLLIHTHYYFPDVPRGLEQAARKVAPGGHLVIAAAPRAELNQLAEAFWPHPGEDGLWFSADIARYLSDREIDVEPIRIDGRLDVTSCFEDTDQGEAIRDFIVQAETRHLPPSVVEEIDRELRGMARLEPDDRWTVPHPVDLYELDSARLRGFSDADQPSMKIIATR